MRSPWTRLSRWRRRSTRQSPNARSRGGSLMRVKIDINDDMGESYGRWTLGNDVELMPFVSSANVACGYHGGDPAVMRDTVRLARKPVVGLGAHVSFTHLIGFG